MNNKIEKEKLYEWACKNEVKEKSCFEAKKDTNYSINDNYQYIREYIPENVKDFEMLLDELGESSIEYEDIRKTLLVAIMKNKPKEDELEVNEQKNKKVELPSYNYSF